MCCDWSCQHHSPSHGLPSVHFATYTFFRALRAAGLLAGVETDTKKPLGRRSASASARGHVMSWIHSKPIGATWCNSKLMKETTQACSECCAHSETVIHGWFGLGIEPLTERNKYFTHILPSRSDHQRESQTSPRISVPSAPFFRVRHCRKNWQHHLHSETLPNVPLSLLSQTQESRGLAPRVPLCTLRHEAKFVPPMSCFSTSSCWSHHTKHQKCFPRVIRHARVSFIDRDF